MVRSERGITFAVLVITVIVMIMIGTAAAGSAISTYKEAKVKTRIEELELIKEKVSLYSEKQKLSGEVDWNNVGVPVSTNNKAINILDKLNSSDVDYIRPSSLGTGSEKYNNYVILSASTITSELGIDKYEGGDVMLDTKTFEVYSLDAMHYSGQDYYSADDIKGR